MKYHFADIENGSIESAAILDFTDEAGVRRSAVHNLVLTIENHEAQIPDDYTATALMFLAEQNGGELTTGTGDRGPGTGRKAPVSRHPSPVADEGGIN